jgi:hypothetical protein
MKIPKSGINIKMNHCGRLESATKFCEPEMIEVIG